MKKINLPTKITISRIAIVIVMLIGIFTIYLVDRFNPFISNFDFSIGGTAKFNTIYLIIFGLFLIASFSDFLDGYLARKNNEVTDLGKFLDPLADKMLVNGIMIFLCINFYSTRNHSFIPFFCVIIMVLRDLLVDALRLMGAKKNVVIAANYFGKAKTVLQMFAISVVLLDGFPFSYFDASFLPYLHISDFICYIATFVSVLSGVIYYKDNFKNIFYDK